MNHLKRFNENMDTSKTLRDLIGEIEVKPSKYVIKTTKGCLTDLDLNDKYDKIDWLDAEYKLYVDRGGNTGQIYLKHKDSKWGRSANVYFENGVPKIISTYPGDERGCFLFGDVFISSGHDGNYLWNIKTGEYASFSW